MIRPHHSQHRDFIKGERFDIEWNMQLDFCPIFEHVYMSGSMDTGYSMQLCMKH